jgi:iron(III) transport system ATP-binding protein
MSTPSSPDALRIDGLEVRFGDLRAVDGADLSVREGEIVALLGPSGCGKTTLLRCVAGFERSTAGEVALAGEVVESRQRHVAAHRRPVGLVFQDYALFPHKTVADNITFGLGRDAGRKARLASLLALGGLEGLQGRYPHQLSGGQQQRVAVLRSLAPRPRVLLLDEPFSNLDPALRAAMRDEVAALLRAEGVSAVLVTHDRADALAVADRIALMERGQIIQCDTADALYFRPATEQAASFAGEVQYIDGVARGEVVETVLGLLSSAGPVQDGPCRVLVRPEWLIACQGGAPARLSRPRLEGQVVRYAARLPGGHTLEVVTTPGVIYAEDEEVLLGTHVAVPTFPV